MKRALAISEKTLGAQHPDTATSLNNLAALYNSQGDYAAAEPLYKRALAIYEKTLGAQHPDTATSLANLAGLYESQGDYAAAEPLYKRALAIDEKTLGAQHPNTATSLNNLALYKSQGDYAAAEPLYKRALAIGESHPHTATTLKNLSVLYEEMGKYAKALDYNLPRTRATIALRSLNCARAVSQIGMAAGFGIFTPTTPAKFPKTRVAIDYRPAVCARLSAVRAKSINALWLSAKKPSEIATRSRHGSHLSTISTRTSPPLPEFRKAKSARESTPPPNLSVLPINALWLSAKKLSERNIPLFTAQCISQQFGKPLYA